MNDLKLCMNQRHKHELILLINNNLKTINFKGNNNNNLIIIKLIIEIINKIN